MLKKILIISTLILTYSLPTQAQSVNISLDYQSFRPFVHFQLDFGSSSHHQSYRSTYMKGYMDGVNNAYYYDHRFADLVYDTQIYETGYRDGLRDRTLIIRLRGHNWYNRHRFAYDDYYSPTYSVRIWLSGMSLAFLQAPERRLPHNWQHRAHPHFKKYRKWYKKRHHKKRYHNGHKRYRNFEKQYKKRVKRYKKQAHKIRKRHRKKASFGRKNRSKSHFKYNKRAKNSKNHRVKRPKKRQRGSIHKTKSRGGRKAVKKRSKQRQKRKAVKRSRGSRKSKGSRGRGNR